MLETYLNYLISSSSSERPERIFDVSRDLLALADAGPHVAVLLVLGLHGLPVELFCVAQGLRVVSHQLGVAARASPLLVPSRRLQKIEKVILETKMWQTLLIQQTHF